MTMTISRNREEGMRQTILRAVASRRARCARPSTFGTDYVDPDLQQPFAAAQEESARLPVALGLLGPAQRPSFGGTAHA